jgi:hypothetical protein
MRAWLDELTQREFGMSAEDFVDAYKRGDLPETARVEHLASIAGVGER